MPSEWTEATICRIFKKGDKSECQNCRGISLLNVAYKILAQCIKDRLLRNMESIAGDDQSGFSPARRTTDQLFLLREIQAESYEFEKETFVLFVGFKEAHERVNTK